MDKYLAFTLKENTVVDRLETPVLLNSRIRDCSITIDPDKKWRGIWDTGAKTSSIHKRIVDELGLYALDEWTMQTANGIAVVTTYFLDITLPNNVMISLLTFVMRLIFLSEWISYHKATSQFLMLMEVLPLVSEFLLLKKLIM